MVTQQQKLLQKMSLFFQLYHGPGYLEPRGSHLQLPRAGLGETTRTWSSWGTFPPYRRLYDNQLSCRRSRDPGLVGNKWGFEAELLFYGHLQHGAQVFFLPREDNVVTLPGDDDADDDPSGQAVTFPTL